ncbi:hypothetical protein MTBPR1_10601 [Candidatus Terasakiella magnetica]|uniref:Response regulatory domain-containing protein n=1 Tax=Candidatus Terasakiella magnetica TaxID=1867952 RepID=A0A1C3RDR4_9PROT|nr:DUF2336 domain-containing protein [Candidatus Terasakiella magnetica]SCA55354.1 hypothetical protein MTBPR1_10601 [Candidatus Terasakiella magnetica]
MFDWLKGKRDTRPPYDEAKAIAQGDDVEARRDLAALTDLEPELLYFFATDKNAEVRQAVAENKAAPVHAKVILSKDEDKKVREKLASRITELTPALDQDASSRASEMVIEVLQGLANDQMAEIRSILSQEVKQLDNIPHETASKLARDMDASVAAPMLEFSPLLEDEELIEIISESLQDEAITAIAKRDGLGENVAHAVAETESDEAVQALLENQSAQIGDNTLNFISEKAEEHENWHGPLVNRDRLPDQAVQNVAKYVTTNLVNQMIAKHNLPNNVVKDLRRTVFNRLNKIRSRYVEQYANSRVLLAEEDEGIRRQMENSLTELGFIDIRCVEDGETAMRVFEAERTPVKLMICSDNLDDMEGQEILEEVRDLDEDIPFMLLSEKNDEAAIMEAKRYGVNEYILKPYSDADLLKRIENIYRKLGH